ncbi:MAG: hypothetical protein AAFV88_23480 [Planctomycetota bacterium]
MPNCNESFPTVIRPHIVASPRRWLILCFLVSLMGCLANPTFAQDPSFAQETAVYGYMLLQNGNVIDGRISRTGKVFSITRDDESTLRVPASQIAHVAASKSGLYEYRKGNRITGDLRAIHNDIRWCLRNGLLRAAAQDSLQASSLDPSHPTTVQLLKQVAARMGKPKAADSTGPTRLPTVRTVSHEVAAESARKPEMSPVTSNNGNTTEDLDWIPRATQIQFAKRVQPILANRCASCHSLENPNMQGQQANSFVLHSAVTQRWAPKSVAQDNLRSVLDQIDFESPASSPIRERALDDHGGRKSSLGPERSPMIRQLDQWLDQVIAAKSDKTRIDRILDAAPSGDPTFDSAPIPAAEQPTTAGRARRMPEIENPFDPAIFNRRHHGTTEVPQ